MGRYASSECRTIRTPLDHGSSKDRTYLSAAYCPAFPAAPICIWRLGSLRWFWLTFRNHLVAIHSRRLVIMIVIDTS